MVSGGPRSDLQPVGSRVGGGMPQPPLVCLGQLARVSCLVSQWGPGGLTSRKGPYLSSSPVLPGTVTQITCVHADPGLGGCCEEMDPQPLMKDPSAYEGQSRPQGKLLRACYVHFTENLIRAHYFLK